MLGKVVESHVIPLHQMFAPVEGHPSARCQAARSPAVPATHYDGGRRKRSDAAIDAISWRTMDVFVCVVARRRLSLSPVSLKRRNPIRTDHIMSLAVVVKGCTVQCVSWL